MLRLLALCLCLLPAAIRADDLPLESGTYVGTDTGCAGANPGNTFLLVAAEGGYQLRFVTSYTQLRKVTALGNDRFAAMVYGVSIAENERSPDRQVTIEIRGENSFALINPNGSEYPVALRCGPLP